MREQKLKAARINENAVLSVITPELIREAEQHLPAIYLEQLQGQPSYDESIAARFLIAKLVRERYQIADYLPETMPSGMPVFAEDIYWSISHTANRVLVAVCDHPIGIDIERVTVRSPLILSLMGEDEWPKHLEKSWEVFYRVWTAKEALAKRLNISLDDVLRMRLVDLTSERAFLSFEGGLFSIESYRKGNFVLSVATA